MTVFVFTRHASRFGLGWLNSSLSSLLRINLFYPTIPDLTGIFPSSPTKTAFYFSTGSDGKRMDEAKKINSSLTAFGKVILALTSPGNTHVPYRDSRLTRILQGSLGGNCKTTMITAAGPAASSYIETLNSLKFANRAKNVKNYAKVNQDMTDQALLSMYEKEIAKLKAELQQANSDGGPRMRRFSSDAELIGQLQRTQDVRPSLDP